MNEFIVCKRCKHSTMQVSVSPTGEVTVVCATCHKRVLGFFSDDEFLDVLREMDIVKKKKLDDIRGLN